MALIILLNNFLHDFSAAGWLFCTFLLWKLLKGEIPADRGGAVLKQHIKMQKKVYSEYEFYGGLDQVESSLDKINRAFRFN